MFQNVIYSCDGKAELSAAITLAQCHMTHKKSLCWFDVYVQFRN